MKTQHGDLDRWPDPVSPNARRSVFAQDLVVEGDATSSGPIEIQGNVVGSLRAQSCRPMSSMSGSPLRPVPCWKAGFNGRPDRSHTARYGCGNWPDGR